MTRSCLAKILAVCTVALGVSLPLKAMAQVVTYPMYVNDFATTDYAEQPMHDIHTIVHGPIASIDDHREPIIHPSFIDHARRDLMNPGVVIPRPAVLGLGCGTNSCGQVLSQAAVYEGSISNGIRVSMPPLTPPGEVYPNPLGTDKYPLIDLGIGVNNNL